MHSDPIADLLTRIRNGGQAHLPSIEAPFSKLKLELIKVLEKDGFINGHEITTESKFPKLKVHLKYLNKNEHAIHFIKRISRPGLRVYKSCPSLKPIRSGLGCLIVSTSQGLLTDREARKRRIGGEVLCEIW